MLNDNIKLNIINLDSKGMPVREPIDLTHALAVELDIGTGVVELEMSNGKLSISTPDGTPVIEPWSSNAVHMTVNDRARWIRNRRNDQGQGSNNGGFEL